MIDPVSLITIIQLTAQASLALYGFIQSVKDANHDITLLGSDVQGFLVVLNNLEKTLTTPKNKAYLDTHPALNQEIASWGDKIKLCKRRIRILSDILESCSSQPSPSGKRRINGVLWVIKKKDALEAQQLLKSTQATLEIAMTGSIFTILLDQAAGDKSAPGPDPVAAQAKQGGQLRRAARDGDNQAIKLLLEANTSVNSRSVEGRTALSEAAEHGYVETVRLLLQQADIAVDSAMLVVDGDRGKRTPLHWASACGHTKVVGLLLDANARIEAWTTSQRQPVMEAALTGHVDTARYLLARGADVDAHTFHGWTMLHAAAKNGNLDLVALLLKHGANTEIAYTGTWHGEGNDESNGRDQRPLHWAIHPKRRPNGNATAIIELLVREGKADIGAKDGAGSTPLHYALRSEWRAALGLLLRYASKYQVRLQDHKGRTILQEAIADGDKAMIEMIKTRLDNTWTAEGWKPV